MSNNEKYLYYFILLIIFPLLFWYAAVFSTDRLYGDSAGYLFALIQKQSFQIVHSRPASVFVEWLPLLLIKAHAPLKYVIYSFSFGECLYFFTWFIIFSKVLKAPGYGIAIVLCYLFGIRWNYYNPVSELILAFPFAFFLSWYWQRQHNKIVWWYIVSLGISLFLVFSHPLYVVVIPVLFVFQYYNQLFKAKNLVFAICLVGLSVMIYLLMDPYEKGVVNNSYTSQSFHLKEALKHLLKKETIISLAKAYAGVSFIGLLFLISLFKKRQTLQLLLLVAFIASYFIYVWLKYNEYFPNQFEPVERYLFIIPLVVLALIAPHINIFSKWQRYAFMVLMLYHIGSLGMYGMFVKERYVLVNNATKNSYQFKENKLIYRIENYCFDIAIYPGHSWTMFYESMLLSSLEGPQNTKQVYLIDILSARFLSKMPQNDQYLNNYTEACGLVSELNPYYFHMAPTAWRMANTDSVQTGLDTIVPKIDYSVGTLANITAEEYYITSAVLQNSTPVPLYSGMRKQHRGIGYQWKNIATGVAERCIYTTPLMCDVYTHAEQKILVFGPKVPGKYEFILGYVTEKPDTFIPFNSNGNVIVNVGERLKYEVKKELKVFPN